MFIEKSLEGGLKARDAVVDYAEIECYVPQTDSAED